MITRSVGSSPLVTTRIPLSVRAPIVTCLGAAVPSACATITILVDWSEASAVSGTSSSGCAGETGSRTRANWPGAMAMSGFRKVARACIVPLLRSTWLSMKSNVPVRLHGVSPSRLICTVVLMPTGWCAIDR